MTYPDGGCVCSEFPKRHDGMAEHLQAPPSAASTLSTEAGLGRKGARLAEVLENTLVPLWDDGLLTRGEVYSSLGDEGSRFTELASHFVLVLPSLAFTPWVVRLDGRRKPEL